MEFNIEAIEAFQTELVQVVEQQKKKDDEKLDIHFAIGRFRYGVLHLHARWYVLPINEISDYPLVP